ncbi:carbamoyl phosphate synthase small subunit [Helicobacter didelphidarum]|uniref:Carbamoyl phosphate synthase small chain n=1 Tax=Helicobacter didelphidarum TaxID=2040648 RepID=A0A3D8IBI4_9HELI|nr:glutamine-hydrolyzing carbamoyl-phosphate synthase small subunit [Helicobacter didelphidarum]RDU62405.1 carbamoyl phosphate synthase small subunit [Helicobacter didelphidarum]
MELHDIWLYFEHGVLIKAKGFGAKGTSIGEAVFNTSLSGYQEIISDPSYAGQFIVFCMPEIGIVGCNEKDMESRQAFAKGVLIRNLSNIKSNFRATENLDSFFRRHNLIGICNVDTRSIVKMLRDNGAMMMIASTQMQTREELCSVLQKAKKIHEINYVQEVSTKENYIHDCSIFNFKNFDYEKIDINDKDRKKIIAIDYGIKRNILNELTRAGLVVEVVNEDFNPHDLIKRYEAKEIGGIFLSNGPGDPLFLQNQIKKVKVLIKTKIPMFGICLGHQILSNAHGFPTYKLQFGQHGGNHPVKNYSDNTLEITSQNHNYNVPESICEVATITHRNLFDNTIEGVQYKDSPIFSVQHHPEASPGPKEASTLFTKFAKIVTSTL